MPKHKVIYDEQCEICQAGVSWLRILDHDKQVVTYPIDPDTLAAIHPTLNLDACLRELHVVTPQGDVVTGADAVILLARLFPETRLIGRIAGAPIIRSLSRILYRFVALNRYALSRCRGGACRVVRPDVYVKRSSLTAFWSCYSVGMMLRLPLSISTATRDTAERVRRYRSTFRKRFDLLDGRLKLLFLGGLPCDVVPLLFGEQFWTVIYEGVAVDPGSPKMRKSLRRHLKTMSSGEIQAVVATHHHEEHVGNLNWLARETGSRVHLPQATADILSKGFEMPWARRFVIGAPPKVEPPFEILSERVPTRNGCLDVYPAPGHCDDHIVLFDPRERLMIVADAFMGVYFSAPNPDVDSRRWIETLERMLDLDIEILIEGHGLVHTLRPDIPDIPVVVIRRDPKEELREKLDYLKWLREQVETGLAEGLPICAVEAVCFPWGRRPAWEAFINDQMMRLFSLGHWSRTELVRSFVRRPNDDSVLPLVYQARIGKNQEVV